MRQFEGVVDGYASARSSDLPDIAAWQMFLLNSQVRLVAKSIGVMLRELRMMRTTENPQLPVQTMNRSPHSTLSHHHTHPFLPFCTHAG